MSEIVLYLGIVIFIIILIICIHIYDRRLLKEIKNYEERLQKKGIFKRHFIKSKFNKANIIVTCKKCSKKFTVKGSDIPEKGRIVKCSFCSFTWSQMPTTIS